MECHAKMDGNKVVGIDRITKDYETRLDENLSNPAKRLKSRGYKPKPEGRIEILKDNSKTRPLSNYAYEDKLA